MRTTLIERFYLALAATCLAVVAYGTLEVLR